MTHGYVKFWNSALPDENADPHEAGGAEQDRLRIADDLRNFGYVRDP